MQRRKRKICGCVIQSKPDPHCFFIPTSEVLKGYRSHCLSENMSPYLPAFNKSLTFSQTKDFLIRLIDFNGISTYIGIFYAERLRWSVCSQFIFSFLIKLFFNIFLAHGLIQYELFLNSSIWPTDGILTDIPNVRVELGVIAMKEYSSLPRCSELKLHLRYS